MSSRSFPFALARRYLLGRKLRAGLTTLAVVFGVTVFFALSLLVPTMRQAVTQNLVMTAGEVDLTVTHVTGGSFAPSVLESVGTVDGVTSATGTLRRNVLLAPELGGGSGGVSAVSVVGVDPVTAAGVRSYPVEAGRFLSATDANAAVIPSSLADKLGVGVGGTLRLPSAEGTARFALVGVLSSRPTGARDVYLPLQAAQSLVAQPDRINVVEGLMSGTADRARVEDAVRARLGNDYRLAGLESGSELQTGLLVARAMFGVFGVLSLVMGAFIIYITSRTAVAERRRDIGMLRAIGASRGALLGSALAEGLSQGLVGTAVGLATGYALTAAMTSMLGSVYREFIAVDLSWPVPSFTTVGSAVLLGVGITVLGSLLPALNASRVAPLQALRPRVEPVAVRTIGLRGAVGIALVVVAALGLATGNTALTSLGLVAFVVGLIVVAPAAVRPIATLFGRVLERALAREGRIAEGNLARQPGRAAITASTLAVGLAVAVALLGTISSVVGGFRNYLDRSLGARFLVMPSSIVLGGGNLGAGPELADRLRATPGVDTVSTLRLATAQIGGTGVGVIGIDPVTFPVASGLSFSQGDPERAYAALGRDRAVILNNVLATRLRAGVGDDLALRTPEGDRRYRVAGIGTDYLNAKLTTAYVSQANLARDFHQSSDVLLMVDPSPSADVAAVRTSLQSAVAAFPVFSLLDSESFRASQEGLLAGMGRAMYVLLLAIAIPGLIGMINTLAIAVVERTREIGMLRAVGMSRTQVRRMILGESVLLAALGTAFGIAAGLWLGYVLVSGLRATGFAVTYDFPWAGTFATVAVGLVLGVVAALVPARQAARMDIVAALRYE